MSSLREFVDGQKCAICRLPEDLRNEVEAGLAEGITTYAVAKWLRSEHGLSLTPSTVDNHRENRRNKHA